MTKPLKRGLVPFTTQQRKELYQRRRAALIAQLGGKCVKCGSTEDLEFDHWPKAVTWDYRKVNRWQRMKKYMDEAKAGLLRLLCSKCNGEQGDPATHFDPRDYESTTTTS